MNKIELAGAILTNERGEILLMHRNTKDLKQWELPGGKLEKDESPEQAATRELKEELDIDVQPVKYLGFREFLDAGRTLKYHWFKCVIKNGEPQPVEEKFDNIKYFSFDELAESPELSSNMKVLLANLDSLDL